MSRRTTTKIHTISHIQTDNNPDDNPRQILTRWNNGVKNAIFVTIGGRLFRGKKIPEKRNIGVIKSV